MGSSAAWMFNLVCKAMGGLKSLKVLKKINELSRHDKTIFTATSDFHLGNESSRCTTIPIHRHHHWLNGCHCVDSDNSRLCRVGCISDIVRPLNQQIGQ